MYRTIYVPVDNSDYSNRAIASAVRLGKAFESKLVGSHVYAAQMHDYRFKQMEYTLPDEYLEETELERQRKIHDSLITMGLQLISDSYLDQMKRMCVEQSLEFEPKMMDGKHHVEIARDIEESGYDLTVIGALGIGRVKDSQIGSVCERVTRSANRDVLVVKNLPQDDEPEGDTILVGIDGSPQSFGALSTAIELAKRCDKKIEAIAVYDPYLHYAVFNGVVNVLTEQAAKVFRFEEQNQLHEEIIDTGLAQIYQSHLDVAETLARAQDCEITKTLLDGKAFQKILDHARKTRPWMVVVGRIGVHGSDGETGLGSNTENLLRSCPCDLLLTTRLEYPELDIRADESVLWTPEAEERMNRVPPMVKGIARTAILRLAMERGHSVITSDLIDDAMDRYMPKSAAEQTARLAEALAFDRARTQPTSICKKCGVTAADPDPVVCTVCGGKVFERITPEMIEQIAAREGGLQQESTYDGRKLSWTQDAKRALWTMKDAYKRRRTKARVEKRARMKKLPAVTLEFTRVIIEEETGLPLELPDGVEQVASETAPANGDLKLVARDAKKNPLFSAYDWTTDAVERLLRVPVGFMRQRTQERIETLAAERAATKIDLALVDDGIEVGRRMMQEMLGGQIASPAAPASASHGEETTSDNTSDQSCPVSTASQSATTAADATDDAREKAENDGAQRKNGDKGKLYLNEVDPLSALRARRKAEQPDA
jgi:nucleotide-binding universal stress UspA family protein